MTPAEFRAATRDIGWSLRHVAERLACDERLVRRWASGEAPVPPLVGRWLADLARYHTRHGPPEAWRTRSCETPAQ
jgi:hypothetical protein